MESFSEMTEAFVQNFEQLTSNLGDNGDSTLYMDLQENRGFLEVLQSNGTPFKKTFRWNPIGQKNPSTTSLPMLPNEKSVPHFSKNSTKKKRNSTKQKRNSTNQKPRKSAKRSRQYRGLTALDEPVGREESARIEDQTQEKSTKEDSGREEGTRQLTNKRKSKRDRYHVKIEDISDTTNWENPSTPENTREKVSIEYVAPNVIKARRRRG
ncbi:unnamed protein product [Bursaphelenchus okinawaensis]|uniref:Uncharacterized protein n=1 Tax=Bursaphelenchus okinawaensis TaxID=465554 RepID=A0A811JST0_9BILA|nr:unnamed protein product [Bursaphelenchus okinawaensis]CAG9081324.1 unnamed protein product [Bursaphelenchus okinawaensis]